MDYNNISISIHIYIYNYGYSPVAKSEISHIKLATKIPHPHD